MAATEVVVIPIHSRAINNLAMLTEKCKEIEARLVEAGIRAVGDYRDAHKPHWKFSHHAGVPIRLELGERDLCTQQCVLWRSDTEQRQAAALSDVSADIKQILAEMRNTL